MDDHRVGSAVRSLRLRRGWRQEDLARRASVSRFTIARIERGDLGHVTLATLRHVSTALDARLDVYAGWHVGDLDRLLDARHAALHEAVAKWLRSVGGWAIAPEASFSIFGERGAIDILAWHSASRTVLVIELKSELVDVSALLGVLDRYRRLAPTLARERGWVTERVSSWLLLAPSRTNRRRVAMHSTTLRAALPDDGRALAGWLVRPDRDLACLSFLPNERQTNIGMVGRAQKRAAARGRVVSHAPRRGTPASGSP